MSRLFSETYLVEACAPGYHGSTCSEICRYPSYGELCQEYCRCDEIKCHHVKGCLKTGIFQKRFTII